MILELAYGKQIQRVNLDKERIQAVLLPSETIPDGSQEELVRQALACPVQSRLLREIVKPGEKIAIISSDITRPMPTDKVMPAVLDELYLAGVTPEDVMLVFAIGSHRSHTEEERRSLAGERAWREICCVDSDPSDYVRMGTTTAGTPVDITRIVAQADRRICLGNIEYHYFAGYSGGAKAIMPGVSTRTAIQCNHSKMTSPNATAGKLDGNPIREDIEEAGDLCGIDFILNVILDEHKRILRAFAGNPKAAHRDGCRILDALYGRRIEKKADIVLVSPGGFPKDINLYQAQKALDNAQYAVRDGGVIILTAACPEGLGESVFQKWMMEATSPEELIERIEKDFQLGGHKAAAIAMVLKKAAVYLVSELEPSLVESLFLTPFQSVQEALEKAFEHMGKNAEVLVMPYGGAVLPLCDGQRNETEG